MLKPGTPEQFRVLREFLKVRFSEEIVAAALGVPTVAAFDQRDTRSPIRDPLVRVFFAGAAVPAREVRFVVPPEVGDTMLELGLLAVSGDSVWSPVMLYPAYDLHLVSDRFTTPDGTPADPDREFVYFPLTANTRTYIRTLPATSCASFLDIGAGCGAAALVQAASAEASVAADTSERCTLYAEFNRRLNDIANMEVVRGSLYEPVGDRKFARIGCHPPYDMAAVTPWVFADGGADGEFVIRGAIQGLPAHLEPGGEFIGLFRAADCTDKPLEARVQDWLGDDAGSFDIAVVERDSTAAQEYAFASAMSSGGDTAAFEACMRAMAEMHVERLTYCSVLIRRHSEAKNAVVVRRQAGQHCGYEELLWLLAWESEWDKLDAMTAMLRVSPHAELIVRHRMRNSTLAPVTYTIRSTAPFEAEEPCPQWIALVLSELGEGRTGGEVYAKLSGTLAGLDAEQFSAALKWLVSLGAVQVAPGSRIIGSA